MLHSTRDPSSTIPLCKLQRIQVKHSSLRIYSNYIPTTFSNGNQIVSLLRGSPVAHRNSLDRNRFIAKTGIITNSITYHGMLFCHYYEPHLLNSINQIFHFVSGISLGV